MPLVIKSWESDGDGGFYIQWHDTQQDVTAYIHATPELMDEFIVHHRKHRGAPVDRLNAARDGMRSNMADAAKVQLFRLAYEELVDDIVDLKARGLRHNTPHSEHLRVKGGGAPDPVWLEDQKPSEFIDFIHSRP